MPSSAPQIPAEAIEAAAEAMFVEITERLRADARAGLEAAHPRLLAVWAERLLSDEVVDEVADEWTEGEEGLAPSFIRELGETWLRALADAFAADADHLADITKEGATNG